LASAGTFAVGASLPLVVTILAPSQYLIVCVAVCSLLFLAALGGLAAQAGGASLYKGAARVAFWGALAMLVTSLVGRLFGVAVA
ncbi:MAG TPA: VIT1/CCC1 transporter family protein, partial [Methylotenera sp.]|nr:VIT1/CCC1 transporter family protein [Methylotenera sp.]